MTVEQAARDTCSTKSVEGLSLQIIAEARREEPDLLVEVKDARVRAKYEWVFLLLQPYAAESLLRVVHRRPRAVLWVASCFRLLPGQYLLYEWYQTGRCGIRLAAPPGSSLHERGNAVDVERPSEWGPYFRAEGWRHLGKSDPPHFDRLSGRTDIDNRMVAAFQRLANRHAGAGLKEDGSFGARTEAALKRAPAEGWKGEEMAEDLERINITVNGADQTEVIKAYLNRGNALLDASDWCSFSDYARPTYDAKTQTLSIETAKVED